jgi:hypothetical protein
VMSESFMNNISRVNRKSHVGDSELVFKGGRHEPLI